MAGKAAELVCEECAQTGVRKTFKAPQALGSHLSRTHGIAGASRSQVAKRAGTKRTPNRGHSTPGGLPEERSLSRRQHVRQQRSLVTMVATLFPKGIPTDDEEQLTADLDFIEQLRERGKR